MDLFYKNSYKNCSTQTILCDINFYVNEMGRKILKLEIMLFFK